MSPEAGDRPRPARPPRVSPAATALSSPATVTLFAVLGLPEVGEGDDLAALISAGLTNSGITLMAGDVLVVSSKIASKALGLVSADADKARVVAAETETVVAERAGAGGVTRVVRCKAGPVMAAAGVDGSNTGQRGGWLLLPRDPDAVCEALHEALVAHHGVPLGVLLSDTAGRPWRVGQTDFALGAHGVKVVDDLRGAHDVDGRELTVTTRAVADELAAAADLVKGKTDAVPVAVVRGLSHLVPGASGAPSGPGLPREPRPSCVELPAALRGRDLVRTGPSDWFGHGRVEAVRAALGVEPGSDAAQSVGLAPAQPETDRFEAVGRAARVALHRSDTTPGSTDRPDRFEPVGGTADIGQDSVTLGADSPFELGYLAARFQVALWAESLAGAFGSPAADGRTLVVTITTRPLP